MLSEYSLSYKDDVWILNFKQKTSYLRDAIYANRPDLKGTNLNSDDFLEQTSKHIIENLSLKFEGNQLSISPVEMKYGGLSFESTFIVNGLPSNPDFLTIKVDAFDEHEHSIVLFRVANGSDAYLNYFNQEQRLATFDFESHSYVFEEIRSGESSNLIIYALIAVLVLFLVIKVVRDKKNDQ